MYYVTNDEVCKRAGTPEMYIILKRRQLCWTGHVSRMDNDRIPKRILYGEVTEGKRSHDRPRLRFKDCIKADVVKCGLEEEDAKDRSKWRSDVRKGTEKLKKDTMEEHGEKRLRRKSPDVAAPTGFTCHPCARPCKGNAGLQAYL